MRGLRRRRQRGMRRWVEHVLGERMLRAYRLDVVFRFGDRFAQEGPGPLE